MKLKVAHQKIRKFPKIAQSIILVKTSTFHKFKCNSLQIFKISLFWKQPFADDLQNRCSWSENLSKNRPSGRCFPMSFALFIGTSFLQNISGRTTCQKILRNFPIIPGVATAKQRIFSSFRKRYKATSQAPIW